MSIFRKANDDAERYGAMRMQAFDCTVEQLTVRMRAMVAQETIAETAWGAIDALTD